MYIIFKRRSCIFSIFCDDLNEQKCQTKSYNWSLKKKNPFPIASFWPLLIDFCKWLTPLNWVDAFLHNSDIGSSKLSLLSTIIPVFLSKCLQFLHFQFQAWLVQNVLRFKSFVKNVAWNLYGLTFDFFSKLPNWFFWVLL